MHIPKAVFTLMILILAALPILLRAEPLTPSFSYRGYIEEQGAPVTGFVDLEFEVFDALENGTPLAAPIVFDTVGVEAGEFSQVLDFGDAPFIGERVWLEVRVRPTDSGEPFTTLSPRQELRAVPYATHAQFVGVSAISSTEIQDGSIQTSDLQVGSVTNSIIAPGAISEDKLSFTPGDITAVVAGSGLLGGSPSGAATLSLDPATLPPTVQGQCESGTVLTGIAADGELICKLPDMPLVRRIDQTELLGRDDAASWVFSDLGYEKICLDPPTCSDYRRNSTFGTLVCQDDLCLDSTRNRPISAPGSFDPLDTRSLTVALQPPGLGSANQSILGFYEIQADFELFEVFHCPDPSCSTGSKRNISRTAANRSGLSLVVRQNLDAAGLISFVDNVSGELKIYDCDDRACTSGSERVLAGGVMNNNTAVALTTAGNPVIVFFRDRGGVNDVYGEVWSYVCGDARCLSGAEVPIDITTTFYGAFSSGQMLYMRPSGHLQMKTRRYILMGQEYVRYDVCIDASCSAWAEDPNVFSGLFLDAPSGEFLILNNFIGGSSGLHRLNRCTDPSCVGGETNYFNTPLDTVKSVGFLPDNRLVLFGEDSSNAKVMFICAFPFCM